MVDIVTRAGKGSPLTNAEVDANFTNLAEVATVGGEPIGHEDITESSISFTTASRTFSISPVGASFTVWCKGNKHVFTSAQTVVIPNTTGLHYIYFSDAGVLSTKTTFFTWDSDAPTAYVYWNATTGAAVYFGDERHGVVLDWQTHEYLHRTRGAAIANGFAASGYTTSGSGNLDTDAQLAVEGGTFFDEDMQVDIVSTATPTANTWQQDLAFPAKIPVLHLQGTSWVLDAPTNFPLKQGTARPQYNLLSGGVWSTADVSNNKYGTTWVLATNNLTYPVVAIIGQHQADSQGEAEATSFSSLNLPDFPSVEFRPLYKLVYNCADSNNNTPHARIVNVIDLRSLSAANPAANPATDHGNLSGLVDDDHPQYVHISTTRTVSAAVKNSLLPTQTSNSGKYLQTDGSTASWQNVVSASDGALTLNTSGTGISGSATFSANQATASTFTVSSNATSANTASTIVARDTSGNFSAGTISAALSGNATTASTLQTGRTIAMTGDVTYTSPSFNGSQNVTAAATLANSGVTAGVYGSSTAIPSLTVDAKGRVTAASTSAISVGDGAFTVNTGTGLSGGGQLGTANQASATSITLTNTDRGSSQNIFKNIAVSGQNTIVADSNNDTLTIVGGSNVTVTTDSTTDTLTIAASQPSVGNGSFTVNTGSGLTGGAQLGTANQSGNTSITLNHADTSTQASVNNTGNTFIQDITLDDFGHITGLVSATATDANTTYILDGSGTANNVNIELVAGGSGSGTDTINVVGSGATTVAWDETNQRITISSTNTTYGIATDTTAGLIELFSNTDQSVAANAVTTTAGRTYGIQLNSANQAVVNVPWTDTNTTYGIATSTTAGLVEVFSDTDQSVAANTVTTTAGRTYGIQLNSANQAVVNVPWTDTNTTYGIATDTTAGLIKLGSNTDQTVAANTVTATSGRTYAVQLNSSDQAVVNVPWVDTVNTSASNLTSGTLPDARLSGTYTGVTLQTNGGNTHYTTPNSGSASTNDRTVFGLAQYKNDLSNATGAIVFYAPNDANTIMYRLRIEGYLHTGGPTVCCIVQGYRNTTWSQTSKVNLGVTDVQVRFAVETSTGKACVILGDTNTVWSYPMMAITHAMLSYTGVTDAYCKDWTVGLVTSLTGFTSITSTIGNTKLNTDIDGNADTATILQTARTIGGVSFNGSANINLPGVNAAGNQSTTGNAATATTLQTARTINGTSFNGSANITVPANIATSATASAFKVPFANTTASTTGNYGLLQDSTATFTYNPSTNTLVAGTFSGALSGNATTATTLQTSRTINGTSFNGSANITTANWGTARTLTIGNTGKSVNGSGNVSWSLSEIGAAAVYASGCVYENSQTITANYTMTSGKNGMSAGPITINSGITVTVPSGSAWTVV